MANQQRMLKGPGPLLNRNGSLADAGWARQPVLDCNLEDAGFYALRFLQPLRVKRWDYYGLSTASHFYSFTLSDLGYIQMVFAYVVDFKNHSHHEETLTLAPWGGVHLPRSSQQGESRFDNGRIKICFRAEPGARRLEVDWPGFDRQALRAQVRLALPAEHESMAIVIPIRGKRFYYNRKVNCMPAEGWLENRGEKIELTPTTCLGNLDWGRGVWEYRSFWVWSTASGFLPDGRTLGINLGFGFGDPSAANENAILLNGRVNKLGAVDYIYDRNRLSEAWSMRSPDARLTLHFTPFYDRVAQTDLKILSSQVHQLFGYYNGTFLTDEGETIEIKNLIGASEEHHARW